MANSIKSVRALYQARINATTGLPTTGLTNVKAQLYLDGVAKAVATNAIALTELDSTNAPGVYELVITSAALVSAGASIGQNIEVVINSATAAAETIYKDKVTAYSTDDISTLIGTPAGASVSADIAAVQTKLGTTVTGSVAGDIAAVKAQTNAIQSDLETGSASLSTILSNIQSLQNASIGNGVGFVLPTMLIPATGSNSYKVPITIQNDNGALVDPVSNTITVGLLNAAGTDKGAFLNGSSGTPAQVTATRSSTGQYYVMVSIPSTEVEEELVFSFAYTLGSNAMVRFGVTQTLADANAEGAALQSTLLATQTTVNTINSAISNATYGLSALQALLVNGTYGLSAIAGILNNATYGLSAIQSLEVAQTAILNNATYGLAAQNTLLTNSVAAIEGSGFVSAQHSLVSIATLLLASGGKAI